MLMVPHYFHTDDLLAMHDAVLRVFGWLPGVHSAGQLDSMLAHVQNDTYYPNMLEKAVHLFFGLVQFHCFVDGNKRTAIIATSLFLELNGIEIADFEIKMEDVAIWLAKGALEKDDLRKIFRSMFTSFSIPIDR